MNGSYNTMNGNTVNGSYNTMKYDKRLLQRGEQLL